MAARRTRIKGIASIPQRRKDTIAVTEVQEAPHLGPQADGQFDSNRHNLNSLHGISRNGSVTALKSPECLAQDISAVKVSKNEIESNTLTAVTETGAALQDDLTPDGVVGEPELNHNLGNVFLEPRIISVQQDNLTAQNELQQNPQSVSSQQKETDVESIIGAQPQTNQHATGLQLAKNEIKSKEYRTVLLEKPAEKSFSEQLIPPPSPSKVNRTRIKAVLRLGQRHTSFSASESEDESRRNSRHRNDSVCSITSGLQDTNSNLESLSPQKTREFNTLIQRKCRRTEQSRKLAEARRDFYLKFGKKKPDREKLTMIDLIFYNPTTNLMTDSKHKKENKEDVEQKKQEEEENSKIEEANEEISEKQASDEENEIPAPQIKIGPEGEIIIDEQSLVIENKAVKKSREELEKQKIIDTDFETGYGIYKRAKRSKDWNKAETLKFYKALNTIGTDFTLMCELFPRRSRRELKLKFKKEEKINKALIDRAIMKPCDFDFNDFKNEVEIEEQELKEVEKQKERELQIKKETKKRKLANGKTEVKEKIPKTDSVKPVPKKKKPLDIMSVLDDESDGEASETGSDSLDNFEKDTSILEAMKKPTRSGRVPKILKRYQSNVCEEPPKSTSKVELGSLVVVAETGNNGEPVYKVCMVTGEDNRQQIAGNISAVNPVLENQVSEESGCLENIFTLTTTRLDGPDETIPDILEERNITIPAD